MLHIFKAQEAYPLTNMAYSTRIKEYAEIIGILGGGALGGVITYLIRKNEVALIIAGTLVGAGVGYYIGRKYSGR